MILTYKYRIKDSSSRTILNRMSGTVNYVFNYCNETSIKAIKRDHRWLSGYDLQYLVAGSSKELGLHSQTVQGICREYVSRRNQFKKVKLNWRTAKRHKGDLQKSKFFATKSLEWLSPYHQKFECRHKEKCRC